MLISIISSMFYNNYYYLFQKILEKSTQLNALATSFVQTAKRCGKIIISELHMDDQYRTIQESPDVGGEAGGKKFIHHGIIFKLAQDWKGVRKLFCLLKRTDR